MAAKPDGFKDFVLDQLRDLPDLICRAMFGGYGLYQRDTFFGIIHKGRLYFKTDSVTAARYRDRGMKPFTPHPLKRSRITMRSQSRSWRTLMISSLGLLRPQRSDREHQG